MLQTRTLYTIIIIIIIFFLHYLQIIFQQVSTYNKETK